MAMLPPFPIDGPVRPASRMIGRERDGADLRSLVADQHASVLMADERRTGKTTLALSVIDELRSAGRIVLECDLTAPDARTPATLASRLASQARATGIGAGPPPPGAIGKLGDAITRADATVAKAIGDLVGEQDVTNALTIVSALLGPKESTPLTPGDVLKALRAHAIIIDEPIVLFVDELQALADSRFWQPNDGEVVEAALAHAARAPHPGGLVLCMAGSDATILERFFDVGRPLSFIGTRFWLKPIPHDDWRIALRERFAEASRTVTADALDLILEKSDGHPRRTMHLCLHATQWAQSNGDVVDDAIVNLAYADVRDQPTWN